MPIETAKPPMQILGYTSLEGYFDRPTGVGKHIEQMFRHLAGCDGVQFKILTAADQLAGRDLPVGHALSGLDLITFPGSRRFHERSWAFLPFPNIDRHIGRPDWIYTPYEVPIPTKHSRLALTFHALHNFDRRVPDYSSRGNRLARLRWRPAFRKGIERADVLLTVSEFVKGQLVAWFGADESRVRVVGNGVEPVYFEQGAIGAGFAGAERPFVVCVSGLNALDGAPDVLAVAAELANRGSDIEIRVAGHQHQEPYLSRGRSLPNVRLLGYVDRRELSKLMNESVAMLFLNAYESFGIGAAEAMAAGTPVIATRSTAIPEVVGDAGIYVDPAKPSDIADLIESFANDPAQRRPWILRGRQRAAQFTWSACGERLCRALRE